jgi:transmembrane sensor
MNINKDRLAFLLKAYVEHTISDGELEELSMHVRNKEQDPALKELMEEFWVEMAPDHNLAIPKDEIYQNITKNPLFKFSTSPVNRPLYKWRTVYLYAASLFLVLASGLLVYRYSVNNNVPSGQLASYTPEKTIKPGMAKAVLTLGNGSKLILHDAEKGPVASQSGVLLEQSNGRLIYQSDKSQDISEFSQNSISTPRGGEYQLHLADGTIVWLNSASSISYPVAFKGKERRVKILGEAYFEVAKNPKMPFIIEAKGTEVKVLGTHFNVSAYADDEAVKTTLVEGAVRVGMNGHYALLKPDQQAIARNGSGKIQVRNVDATEALAWKNGNFLFNNENIKVVMKVISRWYDIDVVYRGDVANKTFGGTISRFENFEKLLKTLELTGAIHFKIEGRRGIVTP